MVINMSEYKNVPKIRFKGFTDDWEQRKLGEIGNTFTGLSGKTKEDFGHGEAKFVTYMNVFSNPIAQLNKTEPIEIDNKQNQVEYGDVFFTTSSETPDEVGMSSVWLENKGNIYLNSFCFGFRPFVKNDPYYMAYMLRANRFRKSMTLLAQGISRYNISKIGVMNIDIQLPNNQEQERIGKLFSEIDNLITLHQRKCDALMNVKKSLLEKMFPKNSSNIPEIRFKGFTDVWEQRKLEEISNRFDNLRVPVSANDREKGTTPYYGANGIQDYVKGFTHNGEFVLIAEDGANDLKNYPVKYVNGLFWANNHVHVVQGKEGICDNKYLKYCFTKTNIESLLVGGGRAKLNANIMMGIDLEIPSLNEQIKLGRMFSEIDNLITLHQRKLEKLNNIKKSMLDKMFV